MTIEYPFYFCSIYDITGCLIAVCNPYWVKYWILRREEVTYKGFIGFTSTHVMRPSSHPLTPNPWWLQICDRGFWRHAAQWGIQEPVGARVDSDCMKQSCHVLYRFVTGVWGTFISVFRLVQTMWGRVVITSWALVLYIIVVSDIIFGD